MRAQTAVAAGGSVTDLLGEYLRWVDGLEMTPQGKRLRRLAAQRFLAAYSDLDNWMERPTPARVADLARTRGWTFLTWCFCVGRLAPDIDLLAAVGAGNHYVTWSRFNSEDVDRASEMGRRLGWADSWIRLVCVTGMGMVCLWAQKQMDELGDADLKAFEDAVNEAPSMSANHRHKTINYLFGVRQVLYQLDIIDTPARNANRRPLTLPERVAAIPQPEIRRVALRYLEAVSTRLRSKTVAEKAAALVLLGEYLAGNHPEVTTIRDLDRAAHIEPFLAWNLGRPWRGRVARDQPVSLHRSLQAVVDLKGFFEDLAIWGWADQPRRQLMFGTDLPRLPEPLPRALPPDTDRDLMAAVADLSDPAARYGIQILRGTGMRIGELLDLELDCLWDTPNHGTWVKVPLGKLDNERMVPLDPDTLAAFDGWITQRQPQRSLPHPRHNRPADFLFVDKGRRVSDRRIRQGLFQAAADAGLQGPDGRPLSVTPHQLRHTYGTTLANAGMNLQALMALLGHVSPEMTLRYAKLAAPTVRAAYEAALGKMPSRQKLIIAPLGGRAVPERVEWLRQEMLKTRVAHGYCSRHLSAEACPYANICEQCDNFVTTPEFLPQLEAQLDDVTALHQDAVARGWDTEVARHARLITNLEKHIRRLKRTDIPTGSS